MYLENGFETIKSVGLKPQRYKYTELCRMFGDKIPTSQKMRMYQLKEWARYFDFTKDGRYITVIEIYDKALPKIDGRGKSDGSRGNALKEFEQFKISKEDEHKRGVYKIQLDNNIYIGSTIVSFRARFLQHKRSEKINKDTYNMIKDGALFEIVWIAGDSDSEENIRRKEEEYISEYRNNKTVILINKIYKTFNYNKHCIKVQKPKPKLLLEINKEDYETVNLLLDELNIPHNIHNFQLIPCKS